MNDCVRHVPCMDTNPYFQRIKVVEDSGFISVVLRAYQDHYGDLTQVLSVDPRGILVFS